MKISTDNLSLLIEAISKMKPISFEYNKKDKIRGKRIGNTHAVFIFTAKSGQKSTKVHIVQTRGVSDSSDESPFPDFRMFDIEELSDIEILHSEPEFEPLREKYNPEWHGYRDVIAKV